MVLTGVSGWNLSRDYGCRKFKPGEAHSSGFSRLRYRTAGQRMLWRIEVEHGVWMFVVSTSDTQYVAGT